MKTDDYYKNFCRKFKSYCINSKLTLLDVSDKTGISNWELLAIVNELSPENITLSTFFKLCELLNIYPIDMVE